MPENWQAAYVAPIYKGKENRSECKNLTETSVGKYLGKRLLSGHRENTKCDGMRNGGIAVLVPEGKRACEFSVCSEASAEEILGKD